MSFKEDRSLAEANTEARLKTLHAPEPVLAPLQPITPVIAPGDPDGVADLLYNATPYLTGEARQAADAQLAAIKRGGK